MDLELQSLRGAPETDFAPASGTGAAVVLICDVNYLLPTLATALSADRHTGPGVPIELLVLDAGEAPVRRFEVATAGTRIAIRGVRVPQLKEIARYHRDRYLPPIALARFWLDELLGPGIDRFLYIDGDTMIDGELDGLLAQAPPEGRLMAVPDALAIYADEVSRGRRGDLAYLEGLGCTADTYFNSGVLYASRAAWTGIVDEAKAFLISHPERCRSSDQSALNRAARGRLSLLPLRYNFQSEHMMVLDPRRRGMRATIWHFTGAPKPWDAPGWPWDASFNRFHAEAEARLAGAGVPAPVTPAAQIEAGIAHRRRARTRLSLVFPWRRWTRRRRTLAGF